MYCSDCAEGYIVDNTLTTCNFDCRITGCITCASTTTCKTCGSGYSLVDNDCLLDCQTGFYLKDNACTYCPDHCLDCTLSSNNVICNECEDLYYLDDTFTCNPCSNIDANCFDCQQTGGKCTACASGYILSGNTCIK